MELIYCYGIVGEKLSLVDVHGFGEKQVSLIPYQNMENPDMFAVVSYVSEEFSQESIDKNIKDMKWLVERGQIHEQVIDEVMKNVTIIPMKFCTVFGSGEKVKEMMEEKYVNLKFNLENLNNKMEMSVKVYYDIEELKKSLFEKDDELRRKYDEAEEKAKESPGAAYFEKQKVDILLKEKSHQELNEKANNFFEKIKELSVDSRKNDPLNKKLTGKDMLLNAVFLIEKEGIEDFKRGIDELDVGDELEVQIFGGFPPYNFIS
jgi:hypothetical protein